MGSPTGGGSDVSDEDYIPKGYYFKDDLDGGRLIKRESTMVDITSAPQENKVELGEKVAELRTELHTTENSLNAGEAAQINWDGLVTKLKALLALIELMRDGGPENDQEEAEAPKKSPVRHSPKHK